ncbi:prolipoprotein diacylglyceryl transferase [Asticcacaulis sp. 201]|uniref:prolipoprotein diacylglyceryl transferase n=1 Tax=Asticcacaulis sp. 201 TaxID=3028787 RepID=UPI002916DE69|nr:prolipoprotein diacylglyceryl transferase [Asticcacaulis sp. 201]MDV6329749.1 prolipoprotein diacylglyceryl transferase [Asticcacaulis sp. 201]
MNLPDIDPVLIHLGPVAVRWYALAYVAGIVAGWLYVGSLIKKQALWTPRQPPVDAAQLDDLILWITLGIILGGRIGYVLAYDMSIIWKSPLDVFKIWQGGMSFHGGFVGVTLATVLYCKSQRFDQARMLNLGDLLACAAPIGLFFGRIANFVNGELWGRHTNAPWGMIFCNKYIEQQYGGPCPAGLYPRHPSQLYEAFAEGILLFAILFVLVHVYRQFKRPGLIMGVFITGYGVFRIIIENFREPDAQMLPFFKNVITMGQTLSLLMVAGGAFFIWLALRNAPPPADTETPQLDG